jgi:hypothetical protein
MMNLPGARGCPAAFHNWFKLSRGRVEQAFLPSLRRFPPVQGVAVVHNAGDGTMLVTSECNRNQPIRHE